MTVPEKLPRSSGPPVAVSAPRLLPRQGRRERLHNNVVTYSYTFHRNLSGSPYSIRVRDTSTRAIQSRQPNRILSRVFSNRHSALRFLHKRSQQIQTPYGVSPSKRGAWRKHRIRKEDYRGEDRGVLRTLAQVTSSEPGYYYACKVVQRLVIPGVLELVQMAMAHMLT